MLKGINRLPKNNLCLKFSSSSNLINCRRSRPSRSLRKGRLKIGKAYRKVGLLDVNTIIYEGKRYEVLNEIGRDKDMKMF